jgi:hypothetical protein
MVYFLRKNIMRKSPITPLIHCTSQFVESIRQWVTRKRLELALMQYASMERVLVKQIEHDTEALAYTQIQRHITTTRLERIFQ